jgi:gamma-glutamyl hydrolase
MGLLFASGLVALASSSERPIIGIFTAPSTSSHPDCGGACDYLAASYVKWVESAGARAVPIPFHASDAHLDTLLGSVNGAIFPGGGAEIPASAKYLYTKVLDMNKAGDHFPLWGTCLGFEWLLEEGGGVLDRGFDSENISLALELAPAAPSSRMFGGDASLLALLSNTSNPVAMNNHMAGMSAAHFAGTAKLAGIYNVLSTNVDRKGREFVSTIEAKAMPLYGTQWHPEKNNFEWGDSKDGTPYEVINHSPEAVAASQALANFLVGEARRSEHKYATPADEAAALIYNYNATKTGPSFVQEYYFHW